MTDVPGVLRDKNDVATKFAELDIRSCRTLVDEGIIGGGMIPKVAPHLTKSVMAFQLRPILYASNWTWLCGICHHTHFLSFRTR
jgi:hypothetical protein